MLNDKTTYRKIDAYRDYIENEETYLAERLESNGYFTAIDTYF